MTTTPRTHGAPLGALSPVAAGTVEAPLAGGLTSSEAAARLQRAGPNEPAPAPRRTLLQDIVRPLASPIVLILLAASVVAAIAGQPVDAGISMTGTSSISRSISRRTARMPKTSCRTRS